MIIPLIVFAGLAILYGFKRGNASSASNRQALFGRVVSGMRRRVCDSYGCGNFGASRDGGSREHKGQDYLALPGDLVFSPFDGEIMGYVKPYSDDARYNGIRLASDPYTVTILYVAPNVAPSGFIKKGQTLGTVQRLEARYPGISNHVHIEVKDAGTIVDPVLYF